MKQPQPLWLGVPDPYARLRRIETLNLETDFREITMLFYGDFRSVMLSKSYKGFMFNNAAPRISRILSATGELEHRIAKRVIDTTLLGSAVMMHGFEEGVGREAAQRVHAMHSRYAIRDEDFIVVACEEIVVSLDLAERFGWRAVTDKEREALRLYYNQQARAFGSPKALPGTVSDVKAYFENYLDTQLRFEPQNLRLAQGLIQWFAARVPRIAAPLFCTMFLADLDPRIARACGLRVYPKPVTWVAQAALRKLGRKDPVPDGAPDSLAELARTVYPNGWEMSKLGTHIQAKSVASKQSPAEVGDEA